MQTLFVGHSVAPNFFAGDQGGLSEPLLSAFEQRAGECTFRTQTDEVLASKNARRATARYLQLLKELHGKQRGVRATTGKKRFSSAS